MATAVRTHDGRVATGVSYTRRLLAHVSQNLGDPGSAMAQARTALACAEQADHHGLFAWVRGTQALIAEAPVGPPRW
jgi:hypothetical protein